MIVLACILVMLCTLFLDQITKAWAEATQVSQTVIPGFADFRYVKNTGMAFGIFEDNPSAMLVVTILTVVMIVGIAVLFFTLFRRHTAARVCLAVIEAGAVGNLIDRLFLNYVRDFVDISSIGFGVCNLADFYITLGAVALVLCILFAGEDAIFPIGKHKGKAEKGEGDA